VPVFILGGTLAVPARSVGSGRIDRSQGFEPPRLRAGSVPERPSPGVVAGGQVLLQVHVAPDGQVAGVQTLRETPPFTELLRDAVAGWRFQGSRQAGRPQAWPVLVAGIFRPPALVGPAPGTPPRDVGGPGSEVPVPLELVVPHYPPSAAGDAMVLVEVGVGEDGTVAEPRIVEGTEPFAEPALDAARLSRFRPARREGHAVSVFAYLIFGFRAPVAPPPQRPGASP
jgi:hypothetical protein